MKTMNRRAPIIVGVVAIAIVVAVVGLLFSSARGPHFVSGISVVNQTAYPYDVDASKEAGDGWTSVGTVGPKATERFQDVVDQGDHWVLRFSYAGQTAGELMLSRGDLVQRHWRIEVPAQFAEKLRAFGINPPP
jgi:hypothetical protein